MLLKLKATIASDDFSKVRFTERQSLKRFFKKLFPESTFTWPTDERYYLPGINVSCSQGRFLAMLVVPGSVESGTPRSIESQRGTLLSSSVMIIVERWRSTRSKPITPELQAILEAKGFQQINGVLAFPNWFNEVS